MTDLAARSIGRASHQSASGPRIDDWLGVKDPRGWCLKAVRTCYGVDAFDFTPNDGKAPWAVEAYDHAEHKHPTKNPLDVPRGAPVFWRKSGAPGHIAISTGNGKCLSTDINRVGYFDEVPISKISSEWGMTLLGWTEDLNRVRVYTPPLPPTLVDQARRLLIRARDKAGVIRKAKISAALAALPKR